MLHTKKNISMRELINKIKLPALGILLAAFLFTSCKKDEPEFVRTPAAGLVAFNLAPDQPAVGFTLSGNNFANGAIGYNSYTGTYLPIYLGNREVRSFNYNNGSTIAISTATFKDSSFYSAFLVGVNGAYKNVVVEDNYDNVIPVAGKAWVRYINAITDSMTSPVVKIGSMSEPVPYASVSEFKQVDAGTVAASIDNSDNISSSRDLVLEENKIYTVLLVGMPGAMDSTKAIKIRYIQNGTASN